VLSLILQRHPGLPRRFIGSDAAERLMKREKETLFGLLWFLKEAHSDVAPMKN